MSRIANKIRADIATLTTQLIHCGICFDQTFPECKKVDDLHLVSWEAMTSFSHALRNIDAIRIYEKFIRDKSYNFVLRDGSLIQLLYTFRNEDLISHRLCYFPYPEKITQEQGDFDEIFSGFERGPMIRIDFSSELHEDFFHSHTHLHLGSLENCRIPTSAPVGPNVFVLFILRNFYPELAQKYLSMFPLERGEKFVTSIQPVELKEIHIGLA
jgi:hypothetical protein